MINMIKIEFVGGPRCGEVRTIADQQQEVIIPHEPGPGELWFVTYRRTGMRMMSSAARRFDYAGQERSV